MTKNYPSQGSETTDSQGGLPIFFHIYNRGVSGARIFLSDENYLFLLSRMQRYAEGCGVQVIACCLLPTHYHFLIQSESRTKASRFIQRLFNSYSQAFNRFYNRTGTLFESRAKFKTIDSDEYALQVCRYIHLNPVEANQTKRPEDWKYSNYLDLINPRNKNFINQFFTEPNGYQEFVANGLAKESS